MSAASWRLYSKKISRVKYSFASAAFSKCLALRDKYIALSNQRLGDNPRDHDGSFSGFFPRDAGDVMGVKPHVSLDSCEMPPPADGKAWKMNPPPPPPHWKWSGAKPAEEKDETTSTAKASTQTPQFSLADCEIPGPETGSSARRFALNDEGVFHVYTTEGEPRSLSHVPRLKEYFSDLDYLLGVCSDGPAKSFAFRRLKYLASKWTLYTLLNEYQELADMKAVPHR